MLSASVLIVKELSLALYTHTILLLLLLWCVSPQLGNKVIVLFFFSSLVLSCFALHLSISFSFFCLFCLTTDWERMENEQKLQKLIITWCCHYNSHLLFSFNLILDAGTSNQVINDSMYIVQTCNHIHTLKCSANQQSIARFSSLSFKHSFCAWYSKITWQFSTLNFLNSNDTNSIMELNWNGTLLWRPIEP